MTPEVAEYHRAMLMVGLCDRFDQDFDQALENEDPLSDLILKLSACASDRNQTISVLRDYTLDHPADGQKVYDLILEDIRSRYLDGRLSRAQVVTTLYSIFQNLDEYRGEPWSQFTYLSFDYEMLEGKLISEKVFNQCFDAWLFRGEHLDVWKLRQESEQARKPKRPKAYWGNLSAAVFLVALSFLAIAVTVCLTGSRDMADFTEHDWRIWGSFLLSEIGLWGLAFFFAARCGRLRQHPDTAELAALKKYKNVGLNCYPQYENLFFSSKGLRRAVVFRTEDAFAVTIESFDRDHLGWLPLEHKEAFASVADVVHFLSRERDFVFVDPQELGK